MKTFQERIASAYLRHKGKGTGIYNFSAAASAIARDADKEIEQLKAEIERLIEIHYPSYPHPTRKG